MGKMIQKVGACICCCLVCLQFVIQPASAFIPVVVGTDLLYSVLASAAVTCGVTFSAIETFDPVVNAIKDKMVENGISENAIKGYISEGTRLVFDVATGTWKTRVIFSDFLWNGVNTAVKALYSEGTYDITQSFTYEGNLANGQTVNLYNCFPFTFRFNNGSVSATFSRSGSSVFITNSASSYVDKFTDIVSVNFSFGSVSTTIELIHSNGSCSALPFNYVTDLSYTGTISIGQYEVSSAVENPDYDWSNEATGAKIVEFPSTYNGDSNDDSDENKKLVYWPDIERYLQGKNAGDLASVNPTGIVDPSAQPVPNPADAVTDYTEPPVEGSEANTSLRGLLFSKFPFCIPWDIKNAFKLLVAAPVPPAWDIDLVPAAIKQQCGISADTTWHINMDGMEVVGTVARFCSTIGFCLALAIATRKIIRS